ncbi:MAG: TerB family tellurite resistance protein [Saprospiraceae bacterium]|nr:TerB family tellurite resistance protein [Saprospiraceae bacterium]
MNVPLGGLLGFIVGSLAGHYMFDLPRERADSHRVLNAHKRRQNEFLYHVFRLCAKIAKSDGAVSQYEIAHMEKLMRNHFRMSDRGRAEAIKVWKQSKDSSESFDNYARSFYEDFRSDRHQVDEMMHLLFATAAADGGLHPREEELLLRAAGIFHIGRLQYERIKNRYYHTQTQRHAAPTQLDQYYKELGASPSDSKELIKKKYRALAMNWHPDKIAASGASVEEQRRAKEKFQKINEAYEQVMQGKK